MRIGIVSDIHGNAVALDAVLQELLEEPLDEIVCLGDVAAFGPEPGRCLEKVKALEGPVVLGNTDEWLLNPKAAEAELKQGSKTEESVRWGGTQLSKSQHAYLKTFQPTVELELEDGQSLLCFHGSPRSHMDIILASTPQDEVDGMLKGHRARWMAGGHTHEQMLRRVGQIAMVNPGSVGLPRERLADGKVRHPPWAEYALIEVKDGRWRLSLRRALLRVKDVIQAALESDMPHAQDWVQGWEVS